MLSSFVAAVLFLSILVSPLVMHFTQVRHNVLPFDAAAAFPTERTLVGGEILATTLAELVEHELDGTTGWRPNDFFLWGPAAMADNNANRQLGIILAVRESARVFRDHLTKVSASEYDVNLQEAETRLRNDERKFWFPSAESRFREGVESLRLYVAGLQAGTSKPINKRNVELIRMFQTWTDLLGDAHANLLREDIPFLAIDDEFYHAQGVSHVLYHLTLALRHEYQQTLQERPAVLELFDHVAVSLREAAQIKPLVVMDGGPSGLFANHRRNIDVFIIDARQLMYTIREELEK